MKTIKLKIAEAIQDDVNKGIVRIDSSFMHEIDVRPGDIVEIKGERKSVGIIDRAYPGDIGLNIIRMDGLVRRNTRAGLGDFVEIAKCDVKEAKKVIISPASQGIMVKASPTLFKQGLLGRAMIKGDIVSLGGSRRRKNTLSHNPFFDDVFNMLDDSLISFGLGELKFVVADTIPKDAVVVTDLTEVIFNPEPMELKEQRMLEVTYEDIGGLGEEVTKVREMVELPLKHPEIFERLGIEPPKGVLLHGPPGTGKTLLAKAVANETNANFILINGPEIMSKYYGQSEMNLRKKFEDAEKNSPSIIFIDEIDAIAVKREESHGEVERRVVAQLLAIMDGLKSRGKVVVIAASNIPNSLDPALRRPGRFDREIEIGVPDKIGRLNILKIHTRNMPLSEDVKLKKLADITHGFVGADLASLSKEAAMTVLRRILPELDLKEDETISQEILDKLQINHSDFLEALKVVRPSAMREVLVELPNVNWQDVGGLQNVKQELVEAVDWPLRHPDAFKRLGIKPPKGILLYGPPGTGKTLLAKAVATESHANFIVIKGPEMLSKWLGESEKAVRKIFEKARQTSPCIIFFDEMDSIAPKRGGDGDNKVIERVVNQLLTEIDGLQEMAHIVIIGSTNRPDILDTALLRPGRFDRIIYTDVPDKKARLEILKVCTKKMPLSGVDLDVLADKTENYVGADIDLLCKEAGVFALRENINSQSVTMKHFETALQKVTSSVSKEIEEMYKNMYEQFRKAKSNEMKKDKPAYYG
ncbi:MAG: CDC48 family AAA ATPase [Candidatus Woesearchaeota archaeon]